LFIWPTWCAILEWACLQVDQIDVVVLAVDRQPPLAGHEAEVGPQFQQEALDVAQDRRLKIPLGVGVLQPQEVEDVRIPEDVGRGERTVGGGGGQGRGEIAGLPREADALEEAGADLAVELACTPARTCASTPWMRSTR
jgi:hypothetical protein